ncbi:MAG: RnfABCDGE type electron transport complex subunit C [Spiroplasma sp.]|nr:RnfABCDGE type electron transport complex subunit C [Mycoplasmatales bacterium]
MIQKTKLITIDKEIAKVRPHIEFTNPTKGYYHLTNMRCTSGELTIKEGDHVKVGEVIGLRKAAFFEQNIHSTISGTFIAMEKHLNRNGKLTEFAVIENDNLEEVKPDKTNFNLKEVLEFPKEKTLELVKNNTNIGLGGSGFPTYIKLESKSTIHTVVVNAVECEPYLTVDVDTMFTKGEEIIFGLVAMIKYYDAKQGVIGIKTKNKEVLNHMQNIVKTNNFTNILVKPVGNFYPQGYEKDLVKSIAKVKVPANKMPADLGFMVFNSTSLLAIHDALCFNMPLIEREISLIGTAFNTPTNVLVKVGTHLAEVVEKIGGYTKEAQDKVIVLGGPMMGTSVKSDDVIISKPFSTVLSLVPVAAKEEPCISCGTCVYSCPTGLQPVLIVGAMKVKDKEKLAKLNIKNCIECGMCSYVCTSKIDLTKHMRRSKRIA